MRNMRSMGWQLFSRVSSAVISGHETVPFSFRETTCYGNDAPVLVVIIIMKTPFYYQEGGKRGVPPQAIENGSYGATIGNGNFFQFEQNRRYGSLYPGRWEQTHSKAVTFLPCFRACQAYSSIPNNGEGSFRALLSGYDTYRYQGKCPGQLS